MSKNEHHPQSAAAVLPSLQSAAAAAYDVRDTLLLIIMSLFSHLLRQQGGYCDWWEVAIYYAVE